MVKRRGFNSVAFPHSAISRSATLRGWRLTETPYNPVNAIFLLMVSGGQVLGIQFFNGNVDEAIQSMIRHGGYLIAPSGTCFARLCEDETYRRAILAADLAIADSGLMVVLWRLFRGEEIERISGLKYLKHLLAGIKARGPEKFSGLFRGSQRGKNCSSGRSGKRSQLPPRIVTWRRGMV